jgi:hypothetical protein
MLPSDSSAGHREPPDDTHNADRREFLKQAGALSAALVAAQCGSGAAAAPAGQAKPKLPQIQFGKYSISRLICGANPFNAGSHLSYFVNQEMRSYFTHEQILKTLRRCQEVGINCWQSGRGNFDLYRRLIDEAKGGCIGVAHHGEVTDSLFKQGQLDKIHDFLKRVRDAGLMVGVSTHMPAVVDAVESKGWDLDYYMTCVYERHRSEEDLKKLLGQVPIPPGEVYLREDPPRMYKAMRQTKRQCLAFKILAAGRLSEHPSWVERAFRETLEGIKPNDGIIIGIYDRYSDQPAEDAEYVRRFGSSPRVG